MLLRTRKRIILIMHLCVIFTGIKERKGLKKYITGIKGIKLKKTYVFNILVLRLYQEINLESTNLLSHPEVNSG